MLNRKLKNSDEFDSLIESDLLRLENYATEATPGPWYVPRYDDDEEEAYLVLAAGPLAAGNVTIAHTLWPFAVFNPEPVCARRNAQFIAEARNVVPKLFAELRQARRENELLRKVANYAYTYLISSEPEANSMASDLSFALDTWINYYQSLTQEADKECE